MGVPCFSVFRYGFSVLVGAQVGERDGDAGIQESQFTHALGYGRVIIYGGGEDAGIGPELLARAGLVGIAHNLHVVERLSLLVFLLVDVTVAIYLRHHVRRKCVHAAHTHAVESARHLVGALVELTAGMQHGHHHFERALVHLLVLIYRNAAAVVHYGDGIIFVDGYLYVCAVTGHCLVDRVVHGLVHQVVQTFFGDVSNIHCRAFAHGFQALKHLDVTGGIVVSVVLIFCHFVVSVLLVCKVTK